MDNIYNKEIPIPENNKGTLLLLGEFNKMKTIRDCLLIFKPDYLYKFADNPESANKIIEKEIEEKRKVVGIVDYKTYFGNEIAKKIIKQNPEAYFIKIEISSSNIPNEKFKDKYICINPFIEKEREGADYTFVEKKCAYHLAKDISKIIKEYIEK